MSILGGGAKTSQAQQQTIATGLQIQSSVAGKVMPVVYGTTRVSGNLVWYGDFQSHAHQSGGGGGGKGGPSGCFAPEVVVAGPGGGIAIGQIKVGDPVWCVDPETGERVEGRVQIVHVHDVAHETHDKMLRIHHQRGVLHVTANHYLWVDGIEKRAAEDWMPGDYLTVLDGERSEILKIEAAPDIAFTYNLTISPHHNFFADGVMAHNGGGGGSGKGGTSYTYSASVAIGLAMGPVAGVGQVWRSKDQLGGLGGLGAASLLTGQPGQAAWGYLSSTHPGQDLAYSNLAYVGVANMDLGESATLPQISYELAGFGAASVGADCDPAWAVGDLLTSPLYGAALPAAMVPDPARMRSWCAAMGFSLSDVLSEQRACRDVLGDWLTAFQVAAVWSQAQLKFIPYADQTVGAYSVDLTPVMAFDANTINTSSASDPLIKVTRQDVADLNNVYTIEFKDRSNSYNTATVDSRDDAHIDVYGKRAEGNQSWGFITTAALAQHVADLRRDRALGVLAAYEWRTDGRGALLEPMDVVSLTDPAIGLAAYPVRVIKVEESDDSIFTITAEDIPGALSALALRPVPAGQGYAPNYNQDPGDVLAPVLFEVPDALTGGGGLEVWGALSGGALWGGADVYASEDGTSYNKIGTIRGASRYGRTLSQLPVGDARDTAHVPTLAMTAGTLSSVSQADAQALSTLSWLDGELIAYETAALIAPKTYQLSGLVRGAYGTAIAAHQPGADCVRLDGAVFKYAFRPDQIGKTVWLKFVSFNVWGGGVQDISAVTAYQYALRGAALVSPLPNVSGLTTVYQAGISRLSWSAVSDFRAVDYEVRQGVSWQSGQVMGRTAGTDMTSMGDGTYWVSAHYKVANGPDVYSAQPAEIIIAGSQLVSNVIAQWDEQASGWSGTCSGDVVVNGAIELVGAGDLLAAADWRQVDDVISYGGMTGSGTYTVPAAHRITVGRPASCQVIMQTTVHGQSAQDNLLGLSDFLAAVDLTGSILGPSVSALPQVRLSQDGVGWGGWQNWSPGFYTAQSFDFRVVLASSDASVIPILTGFSVKVDVPDRVDCFTALAVPAAGLTVSYAQGLQGNPTAAFNGGPNGAVSPNVQITIVNAQPGDQAVLSAESCAGFTVQITNNGAGAARTVNIVSQGY